MKVLITGGAGFIGRWLLRALPADATIVVVDSLVGEVHGQGAEFPEDVEKRAECIECDVRDTDSWRDAAAGADIVVHLAALTGTGQSMYQQDRYIVHNVLGTSALCRVIAEMDPRPRRLILSSSRAVYGEGTFRDGDRTVYPGPRSASALRAGRWEAENADGAPLIPAPTSEDAPLRPSSIYGMTKMWQEQLVTNFANTSEVDHLILRLQNVYGPLQELSNPYTGILGVLTNGIVRLGRVELFEDGGMSRDFVFVRDVARAFLAGINHRGPLNRTLNVGSNQPIALRDLTTLLSRLSGKEPIVDRSGRFRLGDVRHASADMTAYEEALGPWRPTPLRDGLAEYLDWFLAQPAPPAGSLDDSLSEMARRSILLEVDRCPQK